MLAQLTTLGRVDGGEKQTGGLDDAQLQNDIRLSNRQAAALKQLENTKLGKDVQRTTDGGHADRGMQVLDEMDNLQNEKSKLLQQLQGYGKDKLAMQAWGDFDPNNIQRLKNAGYTINFYTCPESAYQPEWEETYNAMKISTISSKVFFITLTYPGQEIDLDSELVTLPPSSLSH